MATSSAPTEAVVTTHATHDSRPVPDPTALTTAQLQRELLALEKLIGTRLDGMDRAVALFKEDFTRFPTDIDKQTSHLRELLLQKFAVGDERFSGIQRQFEERDVRVEATAKDSKVAVDAALQAAKEAVAKQQEASEKATTKSEAAFTKQIDGLNALLVAINKASDEKITVLKERIDRDVGTVSGRREIATESRATISTAASVAGVVVALVVGIIGGGYLRPAQPLAPQVVYLPSPAAAAVPPVTLGTKP